MATKKLEREGLKQEEVSDPLVAELGKERDRCCDELPIPPGSDMFNLPSGCQRCPVKRECCRLWQVVENSFDHNLSLTEYRRFRQKFYMLKQKRDAALIYLAKRGGASLSPHKPA
jgi:hypothetical protein